MGEELLVWRVRPAKLVVLEQMISVAGFLSALCPRGSKIRVCEVLWLSTYLCAKHAANYGGLGHAPQGNFDFGPFIKCNLVESGTVFAQT